MIISAGTCEIIIFRDVGVEDGLNAANLGWATHLQANVERNSSAASISHSYTLSYYFTTFHNSCFIILWFYILVYIAHGVRKEIFVLQ